jgi:predicted peroxiredoxin
LHLLILAHGGSWDRRFQATSLAASVAAAGGRAEVALFFAALDAWARDRWDELDPDPPLAAAAIQAAAFPPLSSLLGPGRESGAIRLYACSASAGLLGLDPAEVQARVDALAGWPTFARLIGEADRVVTL